MDKSKIVVLGDGFLGNTFKRHGYSVWNKDKFKFNHHGCIINEHKLFKRLAMVDNPVIINTIGISDTRFCEDSKNWNTIHQVNGELPRYLSDLCRDVGAKLVHISTGCVYDTRNVPQSEDAFKSAHCNYVVAKWIGELGCNLETDLIIRPRLLFDSEAPKNGARNNLLCKFQKFDTFLNEYNTVTSNDTIVEAIEALLEADQSGIFNVGQTGKYTIADMANHLGLHVENTVNQEELHKSQGLYLVNNLMDTTKLEKFYTPRNTLNELKRCFDVLVK